VGYFRLAPLNAEGLDIRVKEEIVTLIIGFAGPVAVWTYSFSLDFSKHRDKPVGRGTYN
jgi:hypothetical protein